MMPDIMDTLKSILGDDAENKIRTALGAITATTEENEEDIQSGEQQQLIPAPPRSASISPDSIAQVMKLKSLAEDLSQANDTRSQLLMSLKPYMRSSRQKGIDDAIKLLNLTKFSSLFK